MKKTVLKDISLTVSILVLSFVFCLILREVFEIGENNYIKNELGVGYRME